MSGRLPPVISESDLGWTPAQSWAYALGAPYHVQHDMPVDAMPVVTADLQHDLAEMCARD